MHIINIILKDDAVMVTQEEKDLRLSICNSCEFVNLEICSQCGCLINVRAAYKDANCPLGKWYVDTI